MNDDRRFEDPSATVTPAQPAPAREGLLATVQDALLLLNMAKLMRDVGDPRAAELEDDARLHLRRAIAAIENKRDATVH